MCVADQHIYNHSAYSSQPNIETHKNIYNDFVECFFVQETGGVAPRQPYWLKYIILKEE